MADNTTLPGTGEIIATDDVGGVKFQKVKIDVGGDGVSAPLSNTNPVPISDAGGSITVDGTVAVTGTFYQATQPVSAASLPLPTGASTETTVAGIRSVLDDVKDTVNSAITGAHPVLDTRAMLFAVNPGGTYGNIERTNGGNLKVAVEEFDSALPAGTNNIGDVDIASAPTGASAIHLQGNIANGVADSGNPVKIGGKAFTAVPTPVANAARVDAYYDEYGRQVVSDRDIETGLTVGTTGLRDRLFAQRYTVIADSLADGLAGFWTATTASGGTATSSGGEGLIQSSTGPTGSAQISSTAVPYFPGQVGWFNSAVRFNNTGTANNTRRIGVYTVSGTTPQDGFYYELSGTTLNAVIAKAGTPTAVASTSWSRVTEAPFTLDTSYHSFEIRYTANTVWFYVDNVLRHRVSGTTTSITATLDFPITIHSINTSGATNNLIAVRNCGIGRFGSPAQPVAETGLSAVWALAVGGGTPHDSVDSGNPLKMGGRAQASAPTAVADGDRVNAWYTPNGAAVVKESRSTTPTQASVAASATNVTLLASNTARLGATVYNDSTAILYLKLGATASSTSHTIQMAAGSYYEVPFHYTGIIDGLWASATGSARITELA